MNYADLPLFWSFPPMYTLQPVQETRDKQLRAWRDIILVFCKTNNTNQLVLRSCPLFHNKSINRSLGGEAINTIAQFLVDSGNGEYEDASHSVLLIHLQSPEQLANDIYRWASTSEILGTVYTLFELHSGDEYLDSGFHGCDPLLLRRALEYLQSVQKCTIIPGSTADEDGVKFLARS